MNEEKKKAPIIDLQKIIETEQYKEAQKNFNIIMYIIAALFTFIVFQQVLIRMSSTIITIILLISAFTSFIFLKDFEKQEHKGGIKAFKYILFIGTLMLINDVFLSTFASITGDNTTLYKGMTNIIYFVDIGFVVLSLGLFMNEGISGGIKYICEEPLLNNFLTGGVEELKPGDAFLGFHVVDDTGKITEKPIILPAKDRFLHMLILGPTGCGKTSQSVIPMVYRDMQNPDMGVTVLEPKGDLAEKVFAMARKFDREVIYFNPILPECPYFNPLFGDETDVMENIVTTFNMLNADSPIFFKTMSESLMRNAIRLLKRTYKDEATLIDLNTLLTDSGGKGKQMLNEFSKIKPKTNEEQKENQEIYQWFIGDYYTGMTGKGSKTYEHCSGIRAQVAKLVSNKFLRKVLNPPKGVKNDLDFDDALARGTIITISTAQGKLRDLGRFLGYFIILNLQSSVFRRPGNENTRKWNMLFIDEFQVYSNPGFADMLTQGRSYRVASHLATQARAQIGMGSGSDGKDFIELVSTNARNKIIYPGVSSTDAKYYSEEFGEVEREVRGKTYAKQRFLPNISDERLSISVKQEMQVKYSPTDIMKKEFGYITHSIIKNNSVQNAGVSKIQYIPYELNVELDEMVAEYNERQLELSGNPSQFKSDLKESQSREAADNYSAPAPNFDKVNETKTSSFVDPLAVSFNESVPDAPSVPSSKPNMIFVDEEDTVEEFNSKIDKPLIGINFDDIAVDDDI